MNPSQQEGGKNYHLAPFTPGQHYQPEGDPGHQFQHEGDPDTHLSPQEGASSNDTPSQPGGLSQPDPHFSQQDRSSIDEIPFQQEGAYPNPIAIISENRDKCTHLSMEMKTLTTTSYLHHQLNIYAQQIDLIWNN